MDDLKTESASPLNYLKILFRRKELFIVPLYVGLILGICTGLILPKKYRSSTIILVEEGKTDNPLFEHLTVSTNINQRMNAIKESMLGWSSLTKMLKRLNLDKDVKSQAEMENLIALIQRKIEIRLRGQNIIDLAYEGDDPQMTQAVVKTITEIFIERNLDLQNAETADAINFIEAQLKVYKGKIKSAEIASLKDQLDALLVDSTEFHPRVKELRDQIEQKRKEFAKENLEYSEDSLLEKTSTNPLISEIKKALDNIESTSVSMHQVATANKKDSGDDVVKVMLLDKMDNVMARDVDVNTAIYNMLLQRLETAKITQRLQTSKEGTKYTILDPPRVPLKPVKPNRMVVAFMGLFLGAMAGAGLVFSAELLDKSFLDVEEAKEYLGVPLLGAISKINTVESLQQERERQGWFASLTVIAGVITVLLTVVVSGIIH